mmetsp:Transcript_53566/g.158564  ORF Transcript_53566/g.158564 Transcript_53566/m.158564 type:complete len:446 (+) Transcript_53566:13-1350(+)
MTVVPADPRKVILPSELNVTVDVHTTPPPPGGYGFVIFGQRENERVAIKVQKQGQAVVDEVRALSRTQKGEGRNEHVIRMIYEHSAKGSHYLVMEPAEQELFDLLMDAGFFVETKGPARPRLQPNFAMLMDAVRHLHSLGVVHRDLKLENVMKAGSKLKVVDFGIAYLYTERPGSNTYSAELINDGGCGTKCYKPPEVCVSTSIFGKAPPYSGHAFDVWSMGIILFSLASGFFAFDLADKRDACFRAVAKAQQAGESTTLTVFRQYSKPCVLSHSLCELLDGMLAIDPAKRLTVSEVAAHAWLKDFMPPPPPVAATAAAGATSCRGSCRASSLSCRSATRSQSIAPARARRSSPPRAAAARAACGLRPMSGGGPTACWAGCCPTAARSPRDRPTTTATAPTRTKALPSTAARATSAKKTSPTTATARSRRRRCGGSRACGPPCQA